MAYDFKSWLTGYILGLSGKPLPLSQKEPVAYLYNGVRLPKLPEWDRETYPYAVIAKVETETLSCYRLMCSVVEFSKLETGGVYNDGLLVWKSDDLISYDSTGGAWTQKDIGVYFAPTIWTNHNLYYHSTEDNAGELCLAASEPVPVYE